MKFSHFIKRGQVWRMTLEINKLQDLKGIKVARSVYFAPADSSHGEQSFYFVNVSLLHETLGQSQRDDHLAKKDILLLPDPFDTHERRMCRRMVRNHIVSCNSVPGVDTCLALCKPDPLLCIPFCMTEAVHTEETLYWWSIQLKLDFIANSASL
jgi:hypothetical protein